MISKSRMIFSLILLTCYLSESVNGFGNINPSTFQNFLGLPTDNLRVQSPVVIEKDGIDKNGNLFHVKDILISGQSGDPSGRTHVSFVENHMNKFVHGPGSEELRQPLQNVLQPLFGRLALRAQTPYHLERTRDDEDDDNSVEDRVFNMIKKRIDDNHLVENMFESLLGSEESAPENHLKSLSFRTNSGNRLNGNNQYERINLEGIADTGKSIEDILDRGIFGRIHPENQPEWGLAASNQPIEDDAYFVPVEETGSNQGPVQLPQLPYQPASNNNPWNQLSRNQNLADLERDLEQEQQKFIHTIESAEENHIEKKLFDQLPAGEERQQDWNALNDQQDMPDTQYDASTFDNSYVYIEMSDNLNDTTATDLLNYISAITAIPPESFQDIRISNNWIFFKINDINANSTYVVNTILKYQYKIYKENGITIISCGLGTNNAKAAEVHKHLFNIDSKSEYFPLIAVALCVTIACILVLLFAIFLARRRAHLANKLISDVGKLSGQVKGFDDVESLVNTQKSSCGDKKTWPCTFFGNFRRNITSGVSPRSDNETTPPQEYQDLCRQRMQKSNKNAQLNSTACTTINDTPGLPLTSGKQMSAVNSTPIRITNNTVTNADAKTDSTRSSTSS